MAQTIRPLPGYLVVRPIDKEKQTKGGIILPDSDGQERSEQGEILAIGPQVWHEGGWVTPPTYFNAAGEEKEAVVGDKILFHPYGGREFEVDEVKYHLIPYFGDGRAMAVIEESK